MAKKHLWHKMRKEAIRLGVRGVCIDCGEERKTKETLRGGVCRPLKLKAVGVEPPAGAREEG